MPPGDDWVVILEANQTGSWACLGHLRHHTEAGVVTARRYLGTDTHFWQPEPMEAPMEPPALTP